MATGYEARAGGRNTFASDTPAPVQTTTGASAQSQGTQTVGGESIGGAVGGNFTEAGNVAAGLGQFFEKFMEPAVARKEHEQFFKGFTAAQSGRALDELNGAGNPMTQVFGPSGFAKGAEFYTAQTRINKWSRDTLADTDKLKELAPEELAKHMAETSTGMMTGDVYADEQIQIGLLEAQGPVIQTIAKARYGWQQQNMVSAMSDNGAASGALLQQVAAANAGLGEKADSEAVTVQAQRFLGGMGKPEGMSDDSYQTFMYGFMRKSMQDGNFYAVELLRAKGVTGVLTEAQAKTVDDDYTKYGRKAQALALSDPAVFKNLMLIDARIAQTEMGGKDGASVNDITASYAALNAQIRQVSGVDQDYFSPEDIRAGGGQVINAIVSRFHGDERKAEAAADRAANRQDALDATQAAADARVSSARAAWTTGNVTAAVAGGMSPADFNTIAMEDFSKGDISGVSRAFVQSGWKSEGVASQVQAFARAGLGDKFTNATEQAYTLWKQMDAQNPAMAMTYFGDYAIPFTNFDRMVTGGGISKELAFRDAFADAGQYATQSIPPAERKAAAEQLTSLVGQHSFSWVNPLKWGNYTLTPTAQRELTRAMGDDYARLSVNSPRSPEELAQQAYTMATSSGRFEEYGVYGWRNTRGGTTVGNMLRLQPKEAAEVVSIAINAKLNAVGITDPAGVRVIRTGNDLTLEYLDDGVTKYQHVPFSYLTATANQHVTRVRAGVTAPNRARVTSPRGRDY